MKATKIKRESYSLHTILITSFVILSIFPMLIMSIALYNKSEIIIRENASRYTAQMLKKTNATIDLKLRRFAEDASLILNPHVQQILKDIHAKPLDYFETKVLQEIINESIYRSPGVTSMAIHNLDGKVLVRDDYPGPSDIPLSIIDQVIELNGDIYWRYSPLKDTVNGGTAIQAVRLIKNMNGPDIKPIGILSFTVSEKILYTAIEDLEFGSNGNVMILDRQGTVLSAQNRDMISQTIDQDIWTATLTGKGASVLNRFDHDVFIAYNVSDQTGFKIAGVVPKKEMAPGLRDVLKSGWLWASILFILALFITYFITRAVTKPIRQLVKAMQRVERGDWNLEVSSFSPKEIQFLNLTFNKMTERLQNLIEDEKRAQLKVLESQINPHFLYNTLDTIYWMLYLKGEEEIGGMVVSMANILRYGIGQNEKATTLKDEIENISDYLRIQTVRFGDKLKFDIRVEPAVLDTKAIKLMLQPLVENALKHGFDSSGEILVLADKVGSEVHIEIRDNGKGMSPAAMDVFEGNRHVGKGLGLFNVNDRIRFTFGDQYGLNISSEHGIGTQVKIVLPYWPSKGEDAYA